MSFRRRTVLLAAGAVATAVVLSAVVVYAVTRGELLDQIDASLKSRLTPGRQSVQVQVQASPAARSALERELKQAAKAAPPGITATSTPMIRIRPGVGGRAAFGGSVAGLAPGVQPAGPPDAYFAPGSTLVRQLRAASAGGGIATVKVLLPQTKLGAATGYAQLVQPNGQVAGTGGVHLPITAKTRAVAAGRHPAYFSEATVAHTPLRIYTASAGPGAGVWEIALPLTDVNHTLSRLELLLALVCVGGIALAAAFGLLVSRAALVPLRRLTGAAERVARTQDLGHRINTAEDGELGRLAGSFNTMLDALERSRLAQRQLVSDASHELRTPLASVQANLDVLSLGSRVPARERARVTAAARAQLRELTALVEDLVSMSKTGVEEIELEDVRLDLAAAGAVHRARLHAPRCEFALDAEPCLVRAVPARLDRAIANLLDNAVKWGPPEGPVEIRVRGGAISVRDHGPGIDAEDLPRVFDRFYRAPAARGLQGSGLGLAIVRLLAETHGGSVYACNDPGGGARLTLELPALAMTASDTAGEHAAPLPLAR
jgi:two-component system sensor histidine kinase MprB